MRMNEARARYLATNYGPHERLHLESAILESLDAKDRSIKQLQAEIATLKHTLNHVDKFIDYVREQYAPAGGTQISDLISDTLENTATSSILEVVKAAEKLVDSNGIFVDRDDEGCIANLANLVNALEKYRASK